MKASPMTVLIYGNGASLTGAPRSLLTLLEHKPAEIDAMVVLAGGGELLSRYEAVTPVQVVPVPSARMLSATRVGQELRLAARLTKLGRYDRVVVNTIDYELPLVRAAMARRQARVIIREQPFYLDGRRGGLRSKLLRSLPADSLMCLTDSHAEAFSERLDRRLGFINNVVIRSRPVGARPDRPFTFLAVGSGAHKGIPRALEAFDRMALRHQARLIVLSKSEVTGLPPGATWSPAVEDLGECIEDHADAVLGVADGEPFGRLPVEGALAGLPTIAWDVPGYSDVLMTVGGVRVTPFAIDEFAQAMDRLVARRSTPGEAAERRHAALRAFGAGAAQQWWEWIVDGR